MVVVGHSPATPQPRWVDKLCVHQTDMQRKATPPTFGAGSTGHWRLLLWYVTTFFPVGVYIEGIQPHVYDVYEEELPSHFGQSALNSFLFLSITG